MMVANLLIQSQKYAAAGQATAAQSLQIAIADVKQTVAIKWASKRKDYLAVLEPRMVRSYVSATLLARRHALEGFDFTRAHERLPFVASALGDEVMSRLLADLPDPTDPEPDPTKRRRIAYVPGVFGVR